MCKEKIFYCSCNQVTNFSMDTDSITIGIELCRIPQISLSGLLPKNNQQTLRLFFIIIFKCSMFNGFNFFT